MNQNDNTAPQLLLFPIQRAEAEDLNNCYDTHILYHQTRLAVTEMINTRHIYKLPLEVRHFQFIREFNALAIETGYPPLKIDLPHE